MLNETTPYLGHAVKIRTAEMIVRLKPILAAMDCGSPTEARCLTPSPNGDTAQHLYRSSLGLLKVPPQTGDSCQHF